MLNVIASSFTSSAFEALKAELEKEEEVNDFNTTQLN
jgi:hypothetical protein